MIDFKLSSMNHQAVQDLLENHYGELQDFLRLECEQHEFSTAQRLVELMLSEHFNINSEAE